MSSHVELVHGVPVVGADQPGVGSDSEQGGGARARTRPQGDFFNTISHTAIAPPLDYSFREIKNMSELAEHEPAGGGRKKAATAAAAAAASPTAGKPAQARSPIGVAGRRNPKALITGLRLSYNQLTSLAGFSEAVEAVLGPDARTNLTWLDLSHNLLTNIDEVLLEYPNLTNLQLHGNQISHIDEVRKLHSLTNLSQLTLHGCPVYQPTLNHGLKNPRSGIIYHLRTCVLKSLDFITITNADRRNSLRWSEQNKPGLKKRRPAASADGEGSPSRR